MFVNFDECLLHHIERVLAVFHHAQRNRKRAPMVGVKELSKRRVVARLNAGDQLPIPGAFPLRGIAHRTRPGRTFLRGIFARDIVLRIVVLQRTTL